MEKYMETPTSVACGIDVDDEVKRLEQMKERYAELFEKSHGKIVVDCASDILQSQNTIARSEEIKRYMASRKRKGEDDED